MSCDKKMKNDKSGSGNSFGQKADTTDSTTATATPKKGFFAAFKSKTSSSQNNSSKR